MSDSSKCQHCNALIKESDSFCPNCKYPLKGTDKEKSIFIGQQIIKKDTIQTATIYRQFAQYAMIIIGVWYCFVPFIKIFSNNLTIGEIIQLLVGLIFIVLGLISNKIPKLSLIIAIIILLLNFIFITVSVYKYYLPIFDGASEYINYGLKELFKIGLLIYALYMKIQEEQIKKEHKNLE